MRNLYFITSAVYYYTREQMLSFDKLTEIKKNSVKVLTFQNLFFNFFFLFLNQLSPFIRKEHFEIRNLYLILNPS